MSKGLEALKSFKSYTHNDDYIIENKTWKKVLIDNELKEKYEIIEKELKEREEILDALSKMSYQCGNLLKYKKALEIITNKSYKLKIGWDDLLGYYFEIDGVRFYISKEDHDLLREVLTND